MKEAVTQLTERGQISMPAFIRRKLGLLPGRKIIWKCISENEIKLIVGERKPKPKGVMRGAMKNYQAGTPGTTADWMRVLREGEVS
ncbi:MAG: sporulation regulator [Proteobacteria bacterium]|jgi:bifunctional DNA-binding transcriptional regulator/antitoxin component of YhaV-PrlF toxin-antitoxin module|nr:sporulation regulator [Pseudomonadota bacterium]